MILMGFKSRPKGGLYGKAPKSTLYNGLVAYYNLDETSGTIITDKINGINGVLKNGAAPNKVGKVGKAVSFDGSNDYIDLGYPSALNITGDLTISVWVWNDLYTGNSGNAIVTWANGSYLTYPFHLVILTTGYIRFNNNNNYCDSTVKVSTNKWQHIVCTRKDGIARIYLDGVQVSPDVNVGYPPTGNSFLSISRSDLQRHDGLIDELGIWYRCLTVAEIAELNNQGNGITL
jgi:hypothetical protein